MLKDMPTTPKTAMMPLGPRACGIQANALFQMLLTVKVRLIHRMQIWRTTQVAPGTSCMIVRLVRPQCFVLTNIRFP